jgi:hypothetical protein
MLLQNKNNPRCDVHTLPKKQNYINIILVIIIFEGLGVLSPST